MFLTSCTGHGCFYAGRVFFFFKGIFVFSYYKYIFQLKIIPHFRVHAKHVLQPFLHLTSSSSSAFTSTKISSTLPNGIVSTIEGYFSILAPLHQSLSNYKVSTHLSDAKDPYITHILIANRHGVINISVSARALLYSTYFGGILNSSKIIRLNYLRSNHPFPDNRDKGFFDKIT